MARRAGEKILVHQEELSDRVLGVVAGYLVYAGLVPARPRPSPSSSRSASARWAHRAGSWWRSPRAPTGVAVRCPTGDLTDRSSCGGCGCSGVHGALPEEQDRAQPFEVDLDVEADLAARPGRSDDLADTVDYGAVAAAAAGGRRRRALPAARAPGRPDAPRTCCDADRPGHGGDGHGAQAAPAGAASTWRRPACDHHPAYRPRAAGVPRPRAPTWATGRATCGRRWRRLPDVVAVSPVYETEPVGGPAGQPPYLNLVVELSTDRSPRELLERGPAAGGGGRPGARPSASGPGTLDVDVLLVGDEVVDEPDLVVPHPRMCERRFVLAPWPTWRPTWSGRTWLETGDGEVRRIGRLEDDERHPPSPGAGT